MPRLLVARLWVELKPDKIPTRGYVGRHYQASRPTALPVDISRCRFRPLTFRRSAFNEYLRTRSGRTRSRPSSTDRATASVACGSLARTATACQTLARLGDVDTSVFTASARYALARVAYSPVAAGTVVDVDADSFAVSVHPEAMIASAESAARTGRTR